MKRIYILSIGLLLLSSCNESVKYGIDCQKQDVPKCTDDYHFAICTLNGFETVSCCTDTDINNNTCQSICVNHENGAICESIIQQKNEAVCGNGIIETGEQCEGLNLNGNSCINRYGSNAKGTVVCDPITCKVRFDACEPNNSECGNGVLDFGEDCDGELFGNHTCDSEIPGSQGMLKCTSLCRLDLSNCIVPTCGNGQIDAGESCDELIPDNVSCSDFIRGSIGELSCNQKCELDYASCHFPKAGDRCHVTDELNNGGCDGQGRHFFCQDGIIHTEVCAFHDKAMDAICGIFEQDDKSWWAGCVPTMNTCDQPGEIARRCVPASTYHNAVNVCSHDSISDKNYWIEAPNPEINFCTFSCDPKSGECSRLTSDEGTLCEAGTEPRCDGNLAVNCRVANLDNIIEVKSCNDKCVIYESGIQSKKVADCFSDEQNKCQVGDPDVEACHGNKAVTLSCKPIVNDETNGILIVKSENSCTNGCDPDTGKCIKLTELEGEQCTSKTKNRCINEEIILYCGSDKKTSTRVCIDDQGNEGYCIEDENGANCHEICNEIGATKTRCVADTDSYTAYVATETCTEVKDHLLFMETDKEKCDWGCNEKMDGCFKFREEQGEPCDEDEDITTCDGNIISWCKEGRRMLFDCSFYHEVCASFDEKTSSCVNPCYEKDKEIIRCGLNEEKFEYATVKYVCEEDVHGTLFETLIDYEICSDGCNETLDACISCEPGDVMSFCSEESGATFYAQCKIVDDHSSWDYIMDGENYVYDLCPAGCNEEQTACKKVFDTQGDKCNSDSYINQCIDGYETSCSSSGHIDGHSCNQGQSCHQSNVFDAAGCVPRCTKVSSPEKGCMFYPGFGSLTYETACEEIDGDLYEFTVFGEMCPQGCNNNYTDCAH